MSGEATSPVLISDPRVMAVRVEECGEPLVDLHGYQLLLAEEHPRVSSPARTRLLCREEVALRLVRADSALPGGVRLLVLECHRPVELQARYWEADLRELRERRPDWPVERLVEKNAEFVAPPWETPPHSTGGAVDVTLADSTGAELDMGSPVNELGPFMRTAAGGLPVRAAENRRLLLCAMEAAGFVNYGHEWWDYHYGDRYWAFASGERVARYGAV